MRPLNNCEASIDSSCPNHSHLLSHNLWVSSSNQTESHKVKGEKNKQTCEIRDDASTHNALRADENEDEKWWKVKPAALSLALFCWDETFPRHLISARVLICHFSKFCVKNVSGFVETELELSRAKGVMMEAEVREIQRATLSNVCLHWWRWNLADTMQLLYLR